MSLKAKNQTREPLPYHNNSQLAVERFEISGHGNAGDTIKLQSTRLIDLEIEGSISPFQWAQDGPRGIILKLDIFWHGYMLIPVIGKRE